MKKSKTEICINGNTHTIEVDAWCFGEYQSIYIDGRLYVKGKGRSSTYHLFYIVKVEGKDVIVDIDTSTGPIPLTYKHYVYIDGISIKDGKNIDKEKQENIETVSNGFKEYCRKNIKDALKFGIETALGSALFGIISSFKDFNTMNMVRFTIFTIAVILPIFSVGMLLAIWLTTKNVTKNWDKQYQPVRTRKEKYYM